MQSALQENRRGKKKKRKEALAGKYIPWRIPKIDNRILPISVFASILILIGPIVLLRRRLAELLLPKIAGRFPVQVGKDDVEHV